MRKLITLKNIAPRKEKYRGTVGILQSVWCEDGGKANTRGLSESEGSWTENPNGSNTCDAPLLVATCMVSMMLPRIRIHLSFGTEATTNQKPETWTMWWRQNSPDASSWMHLSGPSFHQSRLTLVPDPINFFWTKRGKVQPIKERGCKCTSASSSISYDDVSAPINTVLALLSSSSLQH